MSNARRFVVALALLAWWLPAVSAARLAAQAHQAGEVHQRIGIARVALDARDQRLPQRLQVEPAKRHLHQARQAAPVKEQMSLHEGIDFAGSPGTPILAAAGGVVVYAEYHAGYGNMVEIDHGNDLITRYAHCLKLNVKVGDMVLRGAKIAEMGSSGRSTGTHLHFEVRQRGVSVNPAQFLQLPG